jgi:hypothetical protein
LKEGGSITIVTDDEAYSQIVLNEFYKLGDIYESAFGEEVYSNIVPADYGSSYFDRFWKNGKLLLIIFEFSHTFSHKLTNFYHRKAF